MTPQRRLEILSAAILAAGSVQNLADALELDSQVIKDLIRLLGGGK